MDFNPCMKHKVVRKAVRMFAEAELGPIAHDIDRDARFPFEIVEKMRPLHFFGLQASKAYGGAEMDSISYAITIEEISRVSAAVGLCLTVHNSVGIYPIERFGTEEQKRRFLPAMTSGERIGAFCLTEANAGSDAGGVETVAVRDGNDYVINGTKIFVTNGGVCGTSLIFAISDPQNPQRSSGVFIVERDTPGF
ncbi:MAG: acyl-CoA dehydrogenase, partial [Syntrophus sp. (in: bacteria)]|nr:acyl-CoA dehydrogenase [Syntrophus sp. (in: bacteria)]